MQYQDPIFRGFNPEPSIYRVCKDFCLVTSSFDFFSEIFLYHSTDLVNRMLIGNCMNRPGKLHFASVHEDDEADTTITSAAVIPVLTRADAAKGFASTLIGTFAQ